ncbi:hypothetical protein JHW43_001653 [Diplocarpon mali]|nr:hypothetical protein JHW43_001653 [Diplocarpon mali]
MTESGHGFSGEHHIGSSAIAAGVSDDRGTDVVGASGGAGAYVQGTVVRPRHGGRKPADAPAAYRSTALGLGLVLVLVLVLQCKAEQNARRCGSPNLRTTHSKELYRQHHHYHHHHHHHHHQRHLQLATPSPTAAVDASASTISLSRRNDSSDLPHAVVLPDSPSRPACRIVAATTDEHPNYPGTNLNWTAVSRQIQLLQSFQITILSPPPPQLRLRTAAAVRGERQAGKRGMAASVARMSRCFVLRRCVRGPRCCCWFASFIQPGPVWIPAGQASALVLKHRRCRQQSHGDAVSSGLDAVNARVLIPPVKRPAIPHRSARPAWFSSDAQALSPAALYIKRQPSPLPLLGLGRPSMPGDGIYVGIGPPALCPESLGEDGGEGDACVYNALQSMCWPLRAVFVVIFAPVLLRPSVESRRASAVKVLGGRVASRLIPFRFSSQASTRRELDPDGKCTIFLRLSAQRKSLVVLVLQAQRRLEYVSVRGGGGGTNCRRARIWVLDKRSTLALYKAPYLAWWTWVHGRGGRSGRGGRDVPACRADPLFLTTIQIRSEGGDVRQPHLGSGARRCGVLLHRVAWARGFGGERGERGGQPTRCGFEGRPIRRGAERGLSSRLGAALCLRLSSAWSGWARRVVRKIRLGEGRSERRHAIFRQALVTPALHTATPLLPRHGRQTPPPEYGGLLHHCAVHSQVQPPIHSHSGRRLGTRHPDDASPPCTARARGPPRGGDGRAVPLWTTDRVSTDPHVSRAPPQPGPVLAEARPSGPITLRVGSQWIRPGAGKMPLRKSGR